jgi:hypothetical protein
MPTMMNPSVLMSIVSHHAQKGPCAFSLVAIRPTISIVPITSATATDNPVMVML